MLFRKMLLSALLSMAVLAEPLMAAEVRALPDFTRIVENQGPAVVNISTRGTVREAAQVLPDGMEGDPFFEFFRRFAPPQQQRKRQVGSLGSGFIISKDGTILTNAHVVARADEITVTLTDKREFKARVIGSDARTDVAVLKIQGDNLPVAPIGKSSQVKVGEWVLAIGSPFGFQNSVTSGIVSALGRNLPDENYVPFIQTDAAVNPGNSGGPLFNLNGEVIGINSQIYSQSGGFMGISFAIPIDTAMDIANQLKAGGVVKRARIGVGLQEMNAALAASFGLTKQTGALVSAVEPGGPADKAGMHPGDIVLKVNGQVVDSGSDLQRMIGMLRPGAHVSMEVWRDRASRTLTVVTDELKAESGRAAEREYKNSKEAPPSGSGLDRAGLLVEALTPQQLQRLQLRFALLVKGVRAGAANAGIQPGDLIVGLGSAPLTALSQLQLAVKSAPRGGSIALQVLRNGVVQFVPVKLDETAEP